VTEQIGIIVPNGTSRTRLEDFLFERFPGLSRMYLRGVVRDERCEVNGRFENVGFRVRGGDFIEVELDPTRENSMRPENVPLDIILEDEHLVVVNKPAGMLVHPTNRDKNGTLLNALVYHLNAESLSAERGVGGWVGGSSRSSAPTPHSALRDSALRIPHSAFVRPGLVHRLDKQTSGLIVVAKSVRVHRSLARQFQRKFVEKRYLALVEGTVAKDAGTIEAAIGRFAEQKRWDVKVRGKPSETRYRVKERRGDSTLLELEPVTGRTNQLRIHCASIGHPIVGDVSRGGREFERLCLHAWKLGFRHPVSREDLELTTPWPNF
jgi:23S rRNA pseudouridine1911/1915/1917 synthase